MERKTDTRGSAKQPCIFFDRDGIVNRSPGAGYVERVEDFHLMPEFIEALRVVHAFGYPAVIITNQRGVALGRMSLETVDAIHEELERLLNAHDLELLNIYYCPHENGACDCRKPLPGMLLKAADEHDLDLSRSWMIGDNIKDVQAGRSAGCRTILIGDYAPLTDADFILPTMRDLAGFLREHLAPHT